MLGLFSPAEMPLAVREGIASAVQDALALPEIVQRLEGAGLAPRGTSPGEFAIILDEQRAKWAAIAREHNIQSRQ